jgi:uncharacterized tellurite resistance protein B-like protein
MLSTLLSLHMETPHPHRNIVDDLALIYLAFAHGTDEDLSDEEIAIIAERLLDWQEEGGRDAIIQSVKRALRTYNDAGDETPIEEAIDSIGMSVSREVRAFILDDLMDIAMADDIFRHAESSFIKRLGDRWDVRPSAEFGTEDSLTILHKGDVDGGWTPLHDLALVYLMLVHGTDHNLTINEVEAMTRKLSEWMPDKTEAEMFIVVQGAMNIYGDGTDQKVMDEAVESLKHYVPEHQRKALIDDLEYLAKADGVILDEERELIERLRESFGVEGSMAS